MTTTRFFRTLAAASTAFLVLSAAGLTSVPAPGAAAEVPTEADLGRRSGGHRGGAEAERAGKLRRGSRDPAPSGGRPNGSRGRAVPVWPGHAGRFPSAPGIDGEKREALLDEAIAAFHSMLVTRPELIRVRLELGRAFFLKGEDSLARRHFEQVLAGKPPAAVALNVSRFLSIMRARKRWSVRVGAALAPDSNIGAGSDERDDLHPGAAVPARPGGAHFVGCRGSRCGPVASTSTRWRTAGGCGPAATSRGASTARASSTG